MSEWIRVEDRLPEPYVNLHDWSPEVLVWDADYKKARIAFYAYKSGEWQGGGSAHNYTHWMPLPAAPEVGK